MMLTACLALIPPPPSSSPGSFSMASPLKSDSLSMWWSHQSLRLVSCQVLTSPSTMPSSPSPSRSPLLPNLLWSNSSAATRGPGVPPSPDHFHFYYLGTLNVCVEFCLLFKPQVPGFKRCGTPKVETHSPGLSDSNESKPKSWGSRVRQIVSSFTSCVTPDKSTHLSEPHFHNSQMWVMPLIS